MTTIYKGADRLKSRLDIGPETWMRAFFSTVDQVPVGLVVPGVEHHAVVLLQVPGLDRKLPSFQVFRGCHDIAKLLPMRVATTLESRSSPKRIATSIFSATRSRNRFVMNRSIWIADELSGSREEVQKGLADPE